MCVRVCVCVCVCVCMCVCITNLNGFSLAKIMDDLPNSPNLPLANFSTISTYVQMVYTVHIHINDLFLHISERRWSNLISCGTAPASTTALVCNDEPEAILVNIQQHSNYRVSM